MEMLLISIKHPLFITIRHLKMGAYKEKHLEEERGLLIIY
jgi:hypothetical protein